MENTPLDRYGVPVARIEYNMGDNEQKMAEHMYDTIEEMLHPAKAEVLPYKCGRLDNSGGAIHEHSTCRMGKIRKRARSMFLQDA